MNKINFTKMVATGNDFIVLDNRDGRMNNLINLAKSLCDRRLGIGADGLLIIEKSKSADIKMRIFNPDGSEPGMCGNGARCFAFFATNKIIKKDKLEVETKSGIIHTEISKAKNIVKIHLNNPNSIKLDIPIRINNRALYVNYINTGVPHAVVFVSGLDEFDILPIAEQIRYHQAFSHEGTNVDFIEIILDNKIKMRTYERGVENETLACGTGAIASAIIADAKLSKDNGIKTLDVITKGGILKIYFERKNNFYENVWLQGQVKIVYEGVYYV